MSRITIEIPNSLHRAVKSFVGASGETIKNFFVEAAKEHLKDKMTIDPKTQNSQEKYITEEQADKMLKPLILKYINQIKEGKFAGYSKNEFFDKLKNDKN